MATCPSCNREVEASANFCSHCGEPLRKAKDPAMEAMMADARRALGSNPDDVHAHYNLALAYKLTGMEVQALREFQIVATLQPDFADAHYEVAALLAGEGRKEDAVTALQRALEAEPGHAQAKQLLQRLGGTG